MSERSQRVEYDNTQSEGTVTTEGKHMSERSFGECPVDIQVSEPLAEGMTEEQKAIF